MGSIAGLLWAPPVALCNFFYLKSNLPWEVSPRLLDSWFLDRKGLKSRWLELALTQMSLTNINNLSTSVKLPGDGIGPVVPVAKWKNIANILFSLLLIKYCMFISDCWLWIKLFTLWWILSNLWSHWNCVISNWNIYKLIDINTKKIFFNGHVNMYNVKCIM